MVVVVVREKIVKNSTANWMRCIGKALKGKKKSYDVLIYLVTECDLN